MKMSKHSKRITTAITLIIAIALSIVTVNADAIMSNTFYLYSSPLIRVNATVIVNSPTGSVVTKLEPDSDVPTLPENVWYEYFFPRTLENGQLHHISAAYYHNGEYWGTDGETHGGWSPGWILMDNLMLAYTQTHFRNENRESFYKIEDSAAGIGAIPEADRIVIWEWPGADRPKQVYTMYGILNGRYTYWRWYPRDITHFTDISDVYKDSEGREWGRNAVGWVCLDDPSNATNIPAFNAPEPWKWIPPDTPPSTTPPSTSATEPPSTTPPTTSATEPPSTTPPPPPSFNPYDVNRDGKVNITDAMEILKYLARLNSVVDYNATVGDAMEIFKYLARMENKVREYVL